VPRDHPLLDVNAHRSVEVEDPDSKPVKVWHKQVRIPRRHERTQALQGAEAPEVFELRVAYRGQCPGHFLERLQSAAVRELRVPPEVQGASDQSEPCEAIEVCLGSPDQLDVAQDFDKALEAIQSSCWGLCQTHASLDSDSAIGGLARLSHEVGSFPRDVADQYVGITPLGLTAQPVISRMARSKLKSVRKSIDAVPVRRNAQMLMDPSLEKVVADPVHSNWVRISWRDGQIAGRRSWSR